MIGTAAVVISGALSSLPPPPPDSELLPHTQSIVAAPALGSVLTQGCGALSDGYVALVGPSGSGVAKLIAWTRDASTGTWTYDGQVLAAGLPSPTATYPHERWLATNGRDTVVFSHGASGFTVLRRSVGGWEYRGSGLIASQSGSVRPMAVDGDTLIVAGTSVDVHRRSAAGAWSVVSSAPSASLGLGHVTRAAVEGDYVLVGSSALPPRLAVARIESSGHLSMIQTIEAPHVMPWMFGTSIAWDGDWVAVTARSPVASDHGMAFYRRNPEGTLTLSQMETSAAGAPVHMRGDTLMTTRALWVRDRAGTWHRGGFPSAWPSPTIPEPERGFLQGIVGGDVAYLQMVGAVPILSVWQGTVTDCNSNGVLDALEIAQGLTPDCNLNGVPDACDLALGLLTDANLNGVPDACEQDCDGNGVADLTQIREGSPSGCRDSTVLASCAIAEGAPDTNQDGLVDTCGPDADGNGVPDLLDIANGDALDCNGDGLSDAAPMQQVDAQWEGPGGWFFPSKALLLATVFPTQSDHQLVGAVGLRIQRADERSGGYGLCSVVGQPIRAAIALDPNEDGVPSDAVVIATATGVATDTDWQVLRFEPVEITTRSYFAIFVVQSPTGNDCIDLDLNPDDCGQDNCGRLFGRAFNYSLPTGELQPLVQTAERFFTGLCVPMAVFAAPCGDACDFNGDGLVNGADLGALLAAWGPAQGSVCDVNYDNSVDGADLGVLLSRWGPVRDR